MNPMKIPQGAAGIQPGSVVGSGEEAIIHNKYSGKETLTVEESLDQINQLSGQVLIDGRYMRSIGKRDAGYKAL